MDFSIGRYLEQSFGVFARPTKTKHTIHIAFDSFAAPLVQERQWHPSQKVKQLRDGGIELSLTLGNLEEVERWILSWGRHAQVLAPPELKERIANTVSALANSYGNALKDPCRGFSRAPLLKAKNCKIFLLGMTIDVPVQCSVPCCFIFL